MAGMGKRRTKRHVILDGPDECLGCEVGPEHFDGRYFVVEVGESLHFYGLHGVKSRPGSLVLQYTYTEFRGQVNGGRIVDPAAYARGTFSGRKKVNEEDRSKLIEIQELSNRKSIERSQPPQPAPIVVEWAGAQRLKQVVMSVHGLESRPEYVNGEGLPMELRHQLQQLREELAQLHKEYYAWRNPG